MHGGRREEAKRQNFLYLNFSYLAIKHIYFSKLQMMNMLHIFNLGIRKEHLFVLLGKKTVTDADSAQDADPGQAQG